MDPVQALIELGIIPGPSGVPQGPPPPPAFPPGSTADGNLAPAGVAPVPGPSVSVPMPVPNAQSGLAPNRAGPPETGSYGPDLWGQILEPTVVPYSPSRQGGYGAGASAAPAPSKASGGGPSAAPAPAPAPQGAPPQGAPSGLVTAPEAMASSMSGDSSTALKDPASRQRLMQMLTIMGAVLAQPVPPGGSPMGQIGKAMAMGQLYQDSMTRADEERSAKRIDQGLAARRVGVAEQELGLGAKRVDIARYGAETDRQAMEARREALRADITATYAGVERTRQLMRLQDAKSPLELDAIRAENDLRRAQAASAGANVETPEARRMAKVTELLKPYMQDGAFNMPGAMTVIGLNSGSLGLRRMTPEETSYGKAAYDKLIKDGRTPAEADQILFSLSLQKGLVPKQFSIGAPRR